jgi:hypothetical protein
VATVEVVDAKKTKIDAAAAWRLLKDAGSIAIAKGKKVEKFTSSISEKEEILKHAMGPSGNLRAPTYRAGDQFVIGFNAELYEDWLG